MPLVLHPDLERISRLDLEAHLSLVQMRRLSAAVLYYQGQNAKLEAKVDQLDRRLAGKYEMLGKALATLDKAIEKVMKYKDEIEQIKGERGLNADQIQYIDTEQGDE